MPAVHSKRKQSAALTLTPIYFSGQLHQVTPAQPRSRVWHGLVPCSNREAGTVLPAMDLCTPPPELAMKTSSLPSQTAVTPLARGIRLLNIPRFLKWGVQGFENFVLLLPNRNKTEYKK